MRARAEFSLRGTEASLEESSLSQSTDINEATKQGQANLTRQIDPIPSSCAIKPDWIALDWHCFFALFPLAILSLLVLAKCTVTAFVCYLLLVWAN